MNNNEPRDDLARIKKIVNDSHLYWKPNVERFNEFRKFVFDTAITVEQETLLLTLNKPTLEFNISETFISRLRGEFSKQEPSIIVMPSEGTQVNEQVIKVVEGHLRHAINEANANNCAYDVYTDLLSGGFSVIKIWTEYAHETSFNQVIKFGRVYDPTLCGFDPLARISHKGDGRYCYEFFPKNPEEFREEYPHVDISKFSFAKTIDNDFNWSYRNQKEDVIIICDFYEKKQKEVQIVQLADRTTMPVDEYKKLLVEYKEKGVIAQPPAVVGKRKTRITTIWRHRICENEIIESIETDFKYLPLIFVDGNSILIRNKSNGEVQQMTRPYIYHCKGAQMLKNFAGQTLAAELENMVQHKFKVAKESIPDEEDYLQAYTNVQIASTLVYNAFMDNDPNKPVPAPEAIPRVPCPPEVVQSFELMDQLFQTILGSYDAALGINNNQLSGIAIVEGATQSNSASMPYVVGFMQAWSRLGECYVNLLPKFYRTPRTIPVMSPEGKRSYQVVNDPNNPQESIDFNYDDNALQVRVEAGVSFAIQKNRALEQITVLQKVSPLFAQFMAQEGMDIMLDNIDFKGVEIVKERAIKWMEKMKQQQANQPNPEMIAAQLKMKDQELKAQEIKIKDRDSIIKAQMEVKKAELELKSHEVDAYQKIHDTHMKAEQAGHKHFHESAKLLHEIKQFERESEHEERKESNEGKGEG